MEKLCRGAHQAPQNAFLSSPYPLSPPNRYENWPARRSSSCRFATRVGVRAHERAGNKKTRGTKGAGERSYKEIRKEIEGRSGCGTGRNRARDEETRWRRAPDREAEGNSRGNVNSTERER